MTYLRGRIDDLGNGVENGIVHVSLRLLRRTLSVLASRVTLIFAGRFDVWFIDAAVIIRTRSRRFARLVFHLKERKKERKKNEK